MDGDSAIVLDAPREAVTEAPTPQLTEVSGEQKASPPAEPAAQKPQVDIDALLQSDEYRKTLREKLLESDPELKKQIEHRARSAREADLQARLEAERAKWETERQAEIAKAQAKAERERLKSLDPLDLGEEMKRQLADLDQQEQTQQQYTTAYSKAFGEVQKQIMAQYRKEGDDAYEKFVANDPDLTDEQKRELHWTNPQFASLHEYNQAVAAVKAKVLAAKLAKDLAKIEAEAIVQERLGVGREAQESIPSTPLGGALDDTEFVAAIASGKSKDWKRAREHYEKMGLKF